MATQQLVQQEPRPQQPETDRAMPFYYSVKRIAERWDLSEDKVSRDLELYRGRDGFMDRGSPGSRFRRKRALIRIHPTLLAQIERDRPNTATRPSPRRPRCRKTTAQRVGQE